MCATLRKFALFVASAVCLLSFGSPLLYGEADFTEIHTQDMRDKVSEPRFIYGLRTQYRLSTERAIVLATIVHLAETPHFQVEPSGLMTIAKNMFDDQNELSRAARGVENINNGVGDIAKEIAGLFSLHPDPRIKFPALALRYLLPISQRTVNNILGDLTSTHAQFELLNMQRNNVNKFSLGVKAHDLAQLSPEWKRLIEYITGLNYSATPQQVIDNTREIQDVLEFLTLVSKQDQVIQATTFIASTVKELKDMYEQDKAERKQEKVEKNKIDALWNIQFGASQLFSVVCPKYGRHFDVITKNILSTSLLVDTLLNTTGLSTLQTIGYTFGGLGNILTIVQFFSELGKPSDTEIILGAMRENTMYLASKIDELREEVKLVEENLLNGMNQLSKQLGFVYEDLTAQMVRNAEYIQQVEKKLDAFIENHNQEVEEAQKRDQDSLRKEVRDNLNACVGYNGDPKDSMGDSEITLMDLKKCSHSFLDFATQDSLTHNAFQRDAYTSSFDKEIFFNPSQSPLDTNFGPLMVHFISKKVPHPLIWTIGTQYYLATIQKWKDKILCADDSKECPPRYFQRLSEAADDTKDALDSLLYHVTKDGRSTIDDTILGNLFSDYEMSLRDIGAAIHHELGAAPDYFTSIDNSPFIELKDIEFSLSGMVNNHVHTVPTSNVTLSQLFSRIIPTVFKLAHKTTETKLNITIENPRYENFEISKKSDGTLKNGGEVFDRFTVSGLFVFDIAIKLGDLELAHFSVTTKNREEILITQAVWGSNHPEGTIWRNQQKEGYESPFQKLEKVFREAPHELFEIVAENLMPSTESKSDVQNIPVMGNDPTTQLSDNITAEFISGNLPTFLLNHPSGSRDSNQELMWSDLAASDIHEKLVGHTLPQEAREEFLKRKHTPMEGPNPSGIKVETVGKSREQRLNIFHSLSQIRDVGLSAFEPIQMVSLTDQNPDVGNTSGISEDKFIQDSIRTDYELANVERKKYFENILHLIEAHFHDQRVHIIKQIEPSFIALQHQKALINALLYLGLHQSMISNTELMAFFHPLSDIRLLDEQLIEETLIQPIRLSEDRVLDLAHLWETGMVRLKQLGCYLLGDQINDSFEGYFSSGVQNKIREIPFHCEEKEGLLEKRKSHNELPLYFTQTLVELKLTESEYTTQLATPTTPKESSSGSRWNPLNWFR